MAHAASRENKSWESVNHLQAPVSGRHRIYHANLRHLPARSCSYLKGNCAFVKIKEAQSVGRLVDTIYRIARSVDLRQASGSLVKRRVAFFAGSLI